MMVINLKTSTGKAVTAAVYHLWDVTPDKIVTIKDATPKDEGKFLLFDDGSDWLSPILSVTDYSIRTELCVVRRADYVHLANVHANGMNYSGVKKSEEHPLVRTYDKRENRISNLAIGGIQKPRNWTPRLKMLTLNNLRNEADKRGLDEKYFIDRIKSEAEQPKGTIGDRLKALAILARICGVELEKKEGHAPPRTPLFGNIGSLTIQDQRRIEAVREVLPDTKQMNEILAEVTEIGPNEN